MLVTCWIILLLLRSVTVLSLSTRSPQFVGFDYGTSGARISVIQQQALQTPTSGATASATVPTTAQPTTSAFSCYREIYSHSLAWGEGHGQFDDPQAWLQAADTLLKSASTALDGSLLSSVAAICVSGTSASVLLVDSRNNGRVTRAPCMYNYNVLTSHHMGDPIYGVRALNHLDHYAPSKHTTRSPTGSLAKLLAWHQEQPLSSADVLCHQADYVTMHLLYNLRQRKCGAASTNHVQVSSDWHNCLKLGYDVQDLRWPGWLHACLESAGIRSPTVLPSRVVTPGHALGTLHPSLAALYKMSPQTHIVAGTTDSNAAFVAATTTVTATTGPGGDAPTATYVLSLGTAVTSLGSTLALKQLSSKYVEDADLGVYSHRFPAPLLATAAFTANNGSGSSTYDDKSSDTPPVWWLVGGASNVGCAILRHENFTNEELDTLSATIDPRLDSPLSYYPLTTPGERFPIADTSKPPVLTPVPRSRAEYLHGILQGISDVERDGYLVLGQLGVTPYPPHTIWTSGGGSRNEMWTGMRQLRLRRAFGIPAADAPVQVTKAHATEPSFGAAVLAAAASSLPVKPQAPSSGV